MGGSNGGGSGGSSSTVTQIQDIPAYQQQESLTNEQTANAIAAQPYEAYQGQTVAGFSPLQTQGMAQGTAAANSYQPYMDAANAATTAGTQQWNPTTASQYMSPYASAAMQPQIQALQQQQALNNLQIGSQATQAGAFGDAQQGVAQGLNNFYGNQALNNITATGMNTAYNNGEQQFNTANQNQLAAGQNYAGIGTAAQTAGLTGAQDVFNYGTQQQQLNQTQLTEAYNSFLNQQNYPTQMLNLNMAALANSPYTQANYQSLAPTNATAQNLGAFGALAGGVGSLLGGTGSNGSTSAGGNVFGSDRRFKKNAKKIGELASGIAVYLYQYLWEEKYHVGCMADEVEKIIPEAVLTNDLGYKFINYNMVH